VKSGYVYLLQCRDKTLYTGATTNPEKRLAEHNSGRASKYTRSRLPVKTVFCQEFRDMKDALSAERQIKKWSRQKKLALINSEFELQRELDECQNAIQRRDNLDRQ
jgi:putative endonuclease